MTTGPVRTYAGSADAGLRAFPSASGVCATSAALAHTRSTAVSTPVTCRTATSDAAPRRTAAVCAASTGTSFTPGNEQPPRTPGRGGCAARQGPRGTDHASGAPREGRANRDLGMELRRVARPVLPAGPASAAGTRVREPQGELHRDQWLVLLVAAPHQLPTLVRRDSASLPLRGQREPFHHPHEETQGRGHATCQLLRLRRVASRRQARPHPLAAPALARLPSRPGPKFPGTLAAHHDRGRQARPPPRRAPRRPELDPGPVTSPDPLRLRDPPSLLPRCRVHAPPPPSPGRPRLRRHRRPVPVRGGDHRRLRLPTPPRRRPALRKPIHRRTTRLVGRTDPHMARRRRAR